ncbi:MAG: GspMb/PilO family protein [Acidobacteria bacterium]|nr:GspMb/PilO family protein [Acidobacteriota bacterium]
MMVMAERDRRALMLLGAATLISLAAYFWPAPTIEVVGGPANDTDAAAVRLDRVRREAGLLAERTGQLQQTRAELATLEKGLIAGDSLPQAQAQMIQVVRRIARLQSPALDLRSTDFGPIRPFGAGYGQVVLTVTAECQVDQLVNFLADLPAQPELLAIEELHLSAGNAKPKTILARFVLTGLVRGSLLKPIGAPGGIR